VNYLHFFHGLVNGIVLKLVVSYPRSLFKNNYWFFLLCMLCTRL